MKINNLFCIICLEILLFSCHNNNTETIVEEKWENGKPKKTVEYIIDEDGSKRIHKETIFFTEGQKFIEGTFNEQLQRDGEWIAWFENNKKNSQTTYANGKEHGKYTVWYPNGQIHYTGAYNHGVKIGTWNFYDETGKLIQETNY